MAGIVDRPDRQTHPVIRDLWITADPVDNPGTNADPVDHDVNRAKPRRS